MPKENAITSEVQSIVGSRSNALKQSLAVKGELKEPNHLLRLAGVLSILLLCIASIVYFFQAQEPQSLAAIQPDSTILFTDQYLTPELEPLDSSLLITSVLKDGSLEKVFEELGLNLEDAQSAERSWQGFSKKYPEFFTETKRSEVRIKIAQNSTLVGAFSIPVAEDKLVVFSREKNGKFKHTFRSAEPRFNERVLIGTISREFPSFAGAAKNAGVSYDVVDDLVDLFSDRINFRKDFQVGDRFAVIYQARLNQDGEEEQVGAILAAAFKVKNKRRVAIRYVGKDNRARYFDESGSGLDNGFLRYPLKFTRISSEFSTARFHPVLQRLRPHNGIDFAAPTGTPVRAVASGVVDFAAYKGASGNMVLIRHNDRYTTGYLHLSKISPGLKKGDKVSRGEVIGAVGMTGLATGPHLHFSFLDNGKYVNPMSMDLPLMDTTDAAQRIHDAYRDAVIKTLEHYLQTHVALKLGQPNVS
ncbi:peptidoglycan DD-metalloendopeptidase family protein [bacterium]|nr:peptidoglycan DD-metalloendopeptidase family protein [bacterium]